MLHSECEGVDLVLMIRSPRKSHRHLQVHMEVLLLLLLLLLLLRIIMMLLL